MNATIFFSQGKTSHELPFMWSGVEEVTDGPTRERMFRKLSRARKWKELLRSHDDLVRLNYAAETIQRVLGVRVVTETRDDAGRPLLLEGMMEVGPMQYLASRLVEEEVRVLLEATRKAMVASGRKCEQPRFEEALAEIQGASRGLTWPS
jgi:hypothetical protein